MLWINLLLYYFYTVIIIDEIILCNEILYNYQKTVSRYESGKEKQVYFVNNRSNTF